MKINLQYFLSKRNLSIEKYVSKNKIKNFPALRKNLEGAGVEVPKELKSETSELFKIKRPSLPKMHEQTRPAKHAKAPSPTKTKRRRRSRSRKVDE